MKPWEKYSSSGSGPWAKYGGSAPTESKPQLRGPGAGVSWQEAGIIAKETVKPMIENVQEFGRGLVRGASFGKLGQTETQKAGLSGSVFQPESEKTFGRVGEVVGEAAPVALAGSVALPVASMAGIGSVGAAAMTGAAFGAMKGGVKGQAAAKTIDDVAFDSAAFTVLGGLGKFSGYLRKLFGEKYPELIGTLYLNTPQKIAVDLLEKGKPTLGKQFMDSKPDIASRTHNYNRTRFELERLENQVQGRLGKIADESKAASGKDITIPESERFLTYKPGTVQEISPNTGTSYVPPNDPNLVKKGIRRNPGVGSTTQIGDVASTQEPYGGTYQTLTGRGGVTDFAGQTQVTGSEAFSPLKTAVKAAQTLGEPKRYPFKTPGRFAISKEQLGDKAVVDNVIDDILPQLEKFETNRGRVALLKRIRNSEFFSINDLNDLRRILDSEVGNAYLRQEVTNSVAAKESIANAARKIVAEFDPELGELFAKQHLLINIKNSLAPTIAKSGYNAFSGSLLREASKGFAGSRLGIGSARAASTVLGAARPEIAKPIGNVTKAETSKRWEELKKNRKK